jgi:hypothetical protein
MRCLFVAVLMVVMTATTTFAADQEVALLSPLVTAAAFAPSGAEAAEIHREARPIQRGRPMLLPALYGTAALLQGYDVYSTLAVLKRGGVEVNPVMKGLTKSPTALIGLKAGVTALSIVAAERMWKRHNRAGAVLTMAVSNSLMAMVATNNARVLRQFR